MTNLEIDIAALRRRSHRATLTARLRRHRPFNRRSIREPGARDAYWAAVQARLASIDHEARTLYRDDSPGPLTEPASDAVLALLG